MHRGVVDGHELVGVVRDHVAIDVWHARARLKGVEDGALLGVRELCSTPVAHHQHRNDHQDDRARNTTDDCADERAVDAVAACRRGMHARTKGAALEGHKDGAEIRGVGNNARLLGVREDAVGHNTPGQKVDRDDVVRREKRRGALQRAVQRVAQLLLCLARRPDDVIVNLEHKQDAAFLLQSRR